MNKEEIEELKEFTIDFTDIDELSLGLEICSKKSNMVIQEFVDTIIQLQQENTRLKEKVEYLTKRKENTNRWCQLIADIGFDYDGYNDIHNLKDLIDELCKYALYARDNYDFDEFIRGDSNE